MYHRFAWICIFCVIASPTWAQEKPKKPAQLYEEAEAVYNEKKYPLALQLLNECLKQNPGYFEAYPLRASVK